MRNLRLKIINPRHHLYLPKFIHNRLADTATTRLKEQAIKLIMATDPGGAVPTATVIANLWHQTARPVHAAVLIRGDPRPSFQVSRINGGDLQISFFDAATFGVDSGSFPDHITQSSMDRIGILNPELLPDWERALLLDWDQLPVADFAPLYDMELGDHGIAARIDWKVSLEEGSRLWFGVELPEVCRIHRDQQFVITGGALLNLAALRSRGAYQKAIEAAAAGANDQIAFNVAVGNRVVGIDPAWNYLVSLDPRPETVKAYHWTGGNKPWNSQAPWAAEWHLRRTSFAALQAGAGNPTSSIQLKDVPVYVLTTDEATERWARISEALEREGFRYVIKISEPRREHEYWRGQTVSYLRALKDGGASQQPFLIIEDNALWELKLPDRMEFPSNCDAVYLGTSTWGNLDDHHGYLHYTSERISAEWYRIAGMLSTHAVLYHSPAFVAAAVDVAENCERPLDLDIALLQSKFLVIAPPRPLMRQSDGHNDECTKDFIAVGI